MAATSAMSGDVAPWDYDPKAQEELIAGLRKEYSVTLEKPVESIDWSEGDSLDDVSAFNPVIVVAELPKFSANDLSVLTRKTSPKAAATIAVEALNKALVCNEKAGPHPILLDAQTHIRLALDLYEEYLQSLEVH